MRRARGRKRGQAHSVHHSAGASQGNVCCHRCIHTFHRIEAIAGTSASIRQGTVGKLGRGRMQQHVAPKAPRVLPAGAQVLPCIADMQPPGDLRCWPAGQLRARTGHLLPACTHRCGLWHPDILVLGTLSSDTPRVSGWKPLDLWITMEQEGVSNGPRENQQKSSKIIYANQVTQ